MNEPTDEEIVEEIQTLNAEMVLLRETYSRLVSKRKLYLKALRQRGHSNAQIGRMTELSQSRISQLLHDKLTTADFKNSQGKGVTWGI